MGENEFISDWDFELFCEDGDDLPEEFYEAVTYLHCNWQWVGRRGKSVDLRRVHLQHALNIVEWMDKRHTENTPYKRLPQYKYLQRKIKSKQAWLDLAQRVLQGPKYRWQTLKTYNSTTDSLPSSKEIQEQENPSPRRRTRTRTSSTTTGE